MTNNYLTIGIPVRNEEKSLRLFLVYLEIAIQRLNMSLPELKTEVLFCLNDTTDKSFEIIESAKDKLSYLRIIESKPGKIKAIQKIITERSFQESMICFIDADVLIEKDCILNLVKGLLKNPELLLTYSSVHPYFKKRKNIIERIQIAHYKTRDILTQRKYFHGRAYLVRSNLSIEIKVPKSNNTKWILEDGPCVDDIHFSRLIAYNNGLNVIKEIAESKLQFSPPRSVVDFYLGQRRLLIEIKRLNLLYPEHSYTQSLYFKKKVKWMRIWKLKPLLVLNYLIYYYFEEIIRFLVRIEMLLISLGIIKCKTIWKILKTTK
jgi:hypothetical protein